MSKRPRANPKDRRTGLLAFKKDEEWPRLKAGSTTLLGEMEWPPGFEGGKRLLLDYPEFKLFEPWPPGSRVECEYSSAVESALFRSLCGINDNRVERALSSITERATLLVKRERSKR
jgi:hypothetical protein